MRKVSKLHPVIANTSRSFVNTSKKVPKYNALFHMKTRVKLKYFVTNVRYHSMNVIKFSDIS